jgi:F0F1-type ATP synthase alpha subunit
MMIDASSCNNSISILFAGVKGYLDKMDITKIGIFEKTLIIDLAKSQSKMIETIKIQKKITPEFEKEIHIYMNSFIKSFK